MSHRRWFLLGLALGAALVGAPWLIWYLGALRDFRNATGWGGPAGWNRPAAAR